MKTKIHSLYNKPPKIKKTFNTPGRTQQHFKNECDINYIMRKYAKTGVLTDPNAINGSQPTFGDFSNLPDLQEAKQIVIDANLMFEGLNSKIRKRFGNDPIKLIEFLRDPENKEEAIKLGIVNPEPLKDDRILHFKDAAGVAVNLDSEAPKE